MGQQRNSHITELTEKQQQALDAIASEKYQFVIYGGALGGGKTIWGAVLLAGDVSIIPKKQVVRSA